MASVCGVHWLVSVVCLWRALAMAVSVHPHCLIEVLLLLTLFSLLFPVAPRVLHAPSPQTLFAGSDQTVTCRVSAGVRDVEWSVGGTVVASEAAENDPGGWDLSGLTGRLCPG